MIYRSAPIGYALERFSGREAVVRLWTASVLGRSTGVGVTQVWGTTTMHLRWSGGWRLADWETAPGPTPAVPGTGSAAGSAALLVATSGLRGFRYAPETP